MNVDPIEDDGLEHRNPVKGVEKISQELALTVSHLEILSASELLEKIVSGMDPEENWSPYWKDDVIPFLGGLLKPVCYLRDQGRIALTHKTLLKLLSLEELFKLSEYNDIPEELTEDLKQYLQSLPGFVGNEAIMGSANNKCYECHGHLAMQVARVLNN